MNLPFADEIEITSQLVQAYAHYKPILDSIPNKLNSIKIHDGSQFSKPDLSEQWLEQIDANNAEIRLQRWLYKAAVRKTATANRYPTVEIKWADTAPIPMITNPDTVQDHETRANHTGIGISSASYSRVHQEPKAAS